MCATRFITDREIYEQVIQQEVPAARAFLWIATDDPGLVKQIMVPFDQLWMGERCGPCGRKTYCATYEELLEGGR